MRIHILGICGTFMAGIAKIASDAGHEVTGSDANVYPPMSTQLAMQGIRIINGYHPADFDTSVDCVIVGNVIKRGNPVMEYVMDKGIPYLSGPEWLSNHILKNRTVLAIAGTHGKTTTTSMLAWILEQSGKSPGFLIGGVPSNFGFSARIGESPFFVIEADEYDSAFFDKRSKFIHYRPKILILNNLEFDHADIFSDLSAIQQQFHFLVRTVPGNGSIICHAQDEQLAAVLKMGCWTPITTFSGQQANWQAELIQQDGRHFRVLHQGNVVGEVKWDLLGHHNVNNALAALAGADQAGISIQSSIEALSTFKGVKRRLEVYGEKNGITVYDDFAHHPTAIATTLEGLRAKIGPTRIIVVLEFGSYTMRSGIHKSSLKKALALADQVIFKRPHSIDWGLEAVLTDFTPTAQLYDHVDHLIDALAPRLKTGDHVVIMSNSGFEGIHQKLLNAI